MKDKIKTVVKDKKWKPYVSVQAISIYIIAIVAVSVTWTSVRIVQRNYRLQKEISALQQEVEVAKLEVENQKLQNAYYQSDAFLELAAKRQLNKAEPGEKLIIVPKSVALANVTPEPELEETTDQKKQLSNWQAWLEFLSGRALSD